jgi:hypothetical protein
MTWLALCWISVVALNGPEGIVRSNASPEQDIYTTTFGAGPISVCAIVDVSCKAASEARAGAISETLPQQIHINRLSAKIS